jgi:DNA-binding NarL/FixJ family response regulator
MTKQQLVALLSPFPDSQQIGVGPGCSSISMVVMVPELNQIAILCAALTAREMEIAGLASEGHANKEIAYRLKLTEGSVKQYVRRILAKLALPNRKAMALWYRSHAPERGKAQTS